MLPEQKANDIDLWDYVLVLHKHRQMILRNVMVVAFAIALISFMLPKTYRAVTTILPPEEAQSMELFSALYNSPLSNLILNETKTNSDLYVEILKSRSVLDLVLSREFQYPKDSQRANNKTLLQILHQKSLEKGRKKLLSKMSVNASQEGIITLSVELNDRYLASDVANALVEALDKVNKQKISSRAKNSRIYIENQLQITEQKLKAASEELVKFQEKYKAVSLEEQTKAAIEKAAELKGKILAKNVELGVALQTMKPNNVYVVQLKKEIEELERQYNYLQYGKEKADIKDQKEFYIPFANIPEVGLELANLMREVKVQETVWELLNQQYYQAKIQEARDTPTIQVLDEAVPPELSSRPKRKLLVLVGSFLALTLSMFWAFVIEYLERLRGHTESHNQIDRIMKDLKNDWNQIRDYIRKLKEQFIRRTKSSKPNNKSD
ncbi:MAG: Wzz/FepE/Etk N-terminal domain-containing protein [candidate division KSB1 bacterium]|nr:Wzz/FepE/Etk N-terminal domain-containing protein [candidate division KSB1 bacterium]MDZ7334579.1 Wzz/FepE/Etk N-terminal domain-containing protein [candidate division KSB1 bacterium]MDZ7356742.1 Wzz/FepE/Etk N-terminal domain-containing protein [candidate division KSB1 bacterium]MDZ7399931.1 Wzz/FepE/Etk N-terminal domain-containing protein [candidate division KSB1 bacterium]